MCVLGGRAGEEVFNRGVYLLGMCREGSMCVGGVKAWGEACMCRGKCMSVGAYMGEVGGERRLWGGAVFIHIATHTPH